MTFLLQVTLVLVVKLSEIWARSGGPPLSTCEAMVPHHQNNRAQTGESPYNISVSNSSYTPGEDLTVTISGTNTFKGFILQARRTDGSVAWPVGEFVQIPSGAKYMQCPNGVPKNTVGHNNPGKTAWNSRQFTWMAPAKSAGNITFVATVVHSFTTFWTKVGSSVVAGPPAEEVTTRGPTTRGPTTRGPTKESFQIKKDGCGKTKSCYSEPESCTSSSDCKYLMTMKPLGDEDSDDGEVEFEISTTEEWGAIGFNSGKNKMPGTDALICSVCGGSVSVDHYKVESYDPPTKTIPRPASLVLDSSSSGGVLSCRFRRKKKDDKMVDLTKSWHLVYASGPMNCPAIGKHSTTPKTSPEKVKVADIGTLGAEKEGPEIIQTHGCLMVIAWVGFASIGIFMARYMKVAFGEKVLLGTKVWFTFHRSLMILTVLFTIISIIIIFVHAGRWTKEAGAHPITGIIVLVLAVIQPIMALFRPHPGEAKRYIFNWAHRGVGLSSLILAVVTVVLGIRLPASSLDDSALHAMIVYCVGVAIVIVFELCLTLKKDTTAASFSPSEGDKDGGGHVVLEPAGDQFLFARQLMLVFSVALVSGIVIALVVLIAIADGEGGHEHEH